MDIILYFLGFGLLIAVMMLLLDTQQSRRFNKVLKDTKNVQPLFLLRSAEQKLISLNAVLYGHTNQSSSVISTRSNVNEDARQLISAQLSMLIDEHKSGKMTLNAYHGKLNELLKMTNAVKGMNFERAK